MKTNAAPKRVEVVCLRKVFVQRLRHREVVASLACEMLTFPSQLPDSTLFNPFYPRTSSELPTSMRRCARNRTAPLGQRTSGKLGWPLPFNSTSPATPNELQNPYCTALFCSVPRNQKIVCESINPYPFAPEFVPASHTL